MRKKIGIDFDDVLMDFNGGLFNYYNSINGTSFTRKDITDFKLENLWGCSVEEVRKLVTDFYNSPEHDKNNLVEGASEAIELLSRDHDLIIVTARPEAVRPITERWLSKNFPNKFHSIHFADFLFSKGRSKGEICDELGVELFIDDGMHNAESIAATGKKVFLLDAPWNQGDLKPNIERVYSWKELVNKIKSLVDSVC